MAMKLGDRVRVIARKSWRSDTPIEWIGRSATITVIRDGGWVRANINGVPGSHDVTLAPDEYEPITEPKGPYYWNGRLSECVRILIECNASADGFEWTSARKTLAEYDAEHGTS